MANEWDFNEQENESSNSSGATPLKILQIIWQHKALVLLGIVVGLILSSIYYFRSSPVYESKSKILVIRKVSPYQGAGMGGRVQIVDNYINAQVEVLRSEALIEIALGNQNLKLKSLESLRERSNPVGAIHRSLGVSRDDTTKIGNGVIYLSYLGPVAKDCQIILTGLIRAYEELLDSTYQNASKEVLEKITRARNEVEKELLKLEQEHKYFLENSPVVRRTQDGKLSQMVRVEKYDAKLAEYSQILVTINNTIKAIHNERKRLEKEDGNFDELMKFIPATAQVEEPFELRLERELLPLILQEEELILDYGQDHPRVQSLRRKIDKITDLYNQANKKSKFSLNEVEEGNIPFPVQRYLEKLNRKKTETEILIQSVQKVLMDEDEAFRVSYKIDLKDADFRRKIARKQQLFDGIVKNLDQMNLFRDPDGYDAQILTRPNLGNKVAPKLFYILMGGLFLGTMGGVGLAYLAELTDKGFRTPDEIRKRLGLPVIGHIPVLKPDREALEKKNTGQITLDPYLCSHYNPKSIESEAYRAVRTSLYFSTQGKGHNIIQVTSANMGDGKSTLATNLAVSIAQSGKKTIIVDADLRRPRLHKIFGIRMKNPIGLASVIEGNANLDEAVQKSEIPNLDVLPCGPMPPNPAELLTSPRLQDILGLLRNQYDFVLVDTPPLLVVTDPSVVAPRVDGVILTIRLSKKCGPYAERAREILSTLGVKIVGVVVNGLSHGGSGRFGSSYYTSYAYEANSYDYDPEENEGSYYYQDESKSEQNPETAINPPPDSKVE